MITIVYKDGSREEVTKTFVTAINLAEAYNAMKLLAGLKIVDHLEFRDTPNE